MQDALSKLVSVSHHGTICLVEPLTAAVRTWFEEHVIGPETILWGPAIVVEPRYLEGLLEGLRRDFSGD